MKITKETLRTVYLRGGNLERKTKVDSILNICLRSAINGFDFESIGYDETNKEEVNELKQIAKELREKHNLDVYFDGDKGNMYMVISWS